MLVPLQAWTLPFDPGYPCLVLSRLRARYLVRHLRQVLNRCHDEAHLKYKIQAFARIWADEIKLHRAVRRTVMQMLLAFRADKQDDASLA